MSPEVATRRRRLALRLAAAALVWSLGLLFTGLVVPLYHGQTTSDANGLTLSTATYVQRFGAWTLVPLVLPVLTAIAALAAVSRPSRPRRGAEALIALTALAGVVFVASGGVVLLPVALLAGAGLRLVRPRDPAHRRERRSRRRRPARRATPESEGA